MPNHSISDITAHSAAPNPTLQSERLYLRQWQDSDFTVFAQMSADPKVMQYFPNTLSAAESTQLAKKCQQLIADKGWGFWAVSLKDTTQLAAGQDTNFIGFVGLHEPQADLPFAPCVEVGWRLHANYWGQGYATEAAQIALDFAFENLIINDKPIEKVVSFTAAINQPSRQVMQRLGMQRQKVTNTQQDFDHPAIPKLDPPHPLSEHVLYKITRQQWAKLK
ncbi:MAG: GNAT family N-acetyltransferase [Psychrobacter sp.]|nr:GNAT family N-acetyltransferase [Psychrobacter sp.]